MADGNWRENIKSNYVNLVRRIDPSNGLDGELRKCGAFQHRVILSIWNERDTRQRIEKLLEHIRIGDDRRFNGFCQALHANGQSDIVDNYLLKGGSCQDGPDDAGGDNADCSVHELDYPMSKEDFRMIWNSWNYLVVHLYSSDSPLLAELENRHVFTPDQIRSLKDYSNEIERNEWILRNLEKGSKRHFRDFCKALKICGQDYLVNHINSSVQQLPSSVLDPVPPTAAEPLGEQITAKLPVPGLTFTFPLSEVVEKMKNEVKEQKAYDVTYLPTNRAVPRGRALIIANTRFKGAAELLGNAVDITNLQALFRILKLSVRVAENLTAQEILETCHEESQSETLSSVFVLCILSHGHNGIILGTDENELALDDIKEKFDGRNCRHLLKRPKLFLIQACQGDMETEGIDETDAEVEEQSETLSRMLVCDNVVDAQPDMARHEKADFAEVLATYPGYAAWRYPDRGSCFVQHVTKVFLEQAHEHHFVDMILEVSRRLNQEVINASRKKLKQICQLNSTLDKHVYLLPY
jgi:hypothetical protein